MWRSQQKLVQLNDIPAMNAGAPTPLVVAHEHAVSLFYYLQIHDRYRDGTTVRVVGPNSHGEPVAVIRFERPLWHRLGPPNEEAISGHRLAGLGLRPYAAFEVFNSEIVIEFCRRNRVHPYHRDEPFVSLRHIVITFHDSVFEAIARCYSTEQLGDMSVVAAAMRELETWSNE